ncbi:BCCT family transporter [Staphylococcus chromogenes]|nr:BCCT family transporter [Staphylococcus chromogenes]
MTIDEGNRSAHAELAKVLDNEQHLDESVLHRDIDYAFDDESAGLNWTVVIAAAGIIIAAIAWGLMWPTSMATTASSGLSFVVGNFGWAFVLFGTVFVLFIAGIALSKFGGIRLGRDDEEPEFSTPSWIAMMFAAGMGIGLMFYGATEPLTFYRNGVPGHSEHEVGTAFATTLFHWTLHPWALYALVGLALAYATFRMGRKQLLSSAFIPLIGERAPKGRSERLLTFWRSSPPFSAPHVPLVQVPCRSQRGLTLLASCTIRAPKPRSLLC